MDTPDLTLRQWVRETLREEFGRGALKSLGQNFLVRPSAIESIVAPAVDVAQRAGVRTVVEVGPGLGVLTERLLQLFESVTVIEKDRDVAPWLVAKRFRDESSLRVIEGDARTIDWEQQSVPWVFVSNLPFNAGTFLLGKAVDSATPPECCSVILQREVAERICNKGQGWSVLSVALQTTMEARIATHLPRTAYEPKPNVDTSVLVLTRRSEPLVKFASVADREQFMEVVKWGFSQKRKQIVNPLVAGLSRKLGRSVASLDVRSLLAASDIDPTCRSEQLDPTAWRRVQNALGLIVSE